MMTFFKKMYELITKDGQQGITCLKCRMTSYNPSDIKYLYCGNCKIFHTRY